LNPLLVSIVEPCAAPKQRNRQAREDVRANALPLSARDEDARETPELPEFCELRVRREIFRLAVFL
jgi:hypothetical protein